jgi:Trk K+ transport system NAD-binding subunit
LPQSGPRAIEIVMSELRTSSSGGGLRTRVRYRFDNLLARGTWAVLLWLGAVTVAAVAISAAVLAAFRLSFAGSGDDTPWTEDLWQSMLRVIDAGTMAGDVGWGPRVVALVVTLFGILIAGTLIGLIANGVEQRVDELREGRSTVVETDHVVILGASSRLPIVIEQLALANKGRRSQAVVVLADDEPVELRARVRAAIDELFGSRVVFRRGDPARLPDLAMVALRNARAVIALADDTRGDGVVVKAVLAAGAQLGGFDRVPIVAELSDAEVADSLHRACGDAIHTLVASRSIGRITAFTLREPGLSQVVEELLDFRGCEIYIRPVGGLAGVAFGAAVFRFTTARPIGRIRPDGTIELNPDPRTRLDPQDQLVLIAHDAAAAPAATAFAEVPSAVEAPPTADSRHRERMLLVGWNVLGSNLLSALDEFAAPGSSAVVVPDPMDVGTTDIRIPPLTTVDVEVRPDGSATQELDREDQGGPFTSIVLLAQRGDMPADEADSRTLLSHMLLRRHLDARGRAAPRIVVELLNTKHVDLARVTGADDYVVSDAITSRLLAQLAEEPLRRPVLLSLYAAAGPSVRLIPAGELGLARDVGCDDVITTAYASGLLAVGWRRDADVVLNPPTSRRVTLRGHDQIVVIG